MSDSRAQKLAAIRAYVGAHRHAVLFDEPGDALFDVFAAKSIPLESGDLERVEERKDRQTGQPYLALGYGTGRQLALSDAGVAFAPDPSNSGPVEDLPPAVCLRDFRGLLERLQHELYGHPEREPARDAVKLVMMCIAILDGARAAGFDVSREERELEGDLAELERRAPTPPAR